MGAGASTRKISSGAKAKDTHWPFLWRKHGPTTSANIFGASQYVVPQGGIFNSGQDRPAVSGPAGISNAVIVLQDVDDEINDESVQSEQNDSADERHFKTSRDSSKSSRLSRAQVHPFGLPDESAPTINIFNIERRESRDSRHSLDSGYAASSSLGPASLVQDHMYEMLNKAIRHSGNLVQKSVVVRVLQDVGTLSGACHEAAHADTQMPQLQMKVDPENLLEELPGNPFKNHHFCLQRVSCMGMEWVSIRLCDASAAQNLRFCMCASALHNLGKVKLRSVVLEMLDRADGEVEIRAVACSPFGEEKRHPVAWLNLAEDLSELADIVLGCKDDKVKKVQSELKKWSQKQRALNYGGSGSAVLLTIPDRGVSMWSMFIRRRTPSNSSTSSHLTRASDSEEEQLHSSTLSKGFLGTAFSYFRRLSSVPGMLQTLEAQLASLTVVDESVSSLPQRRDLSPRASPRGSRSPSPSLHGTGHSSPRGPRSNSKSSTGSGRGSRGHGVAGSSSSSKGSAGHSRMAMQSSEGAHTSPTNSGHGTRRSLPSDHEHVQNLKMMKEIGRRKSAPEIGQMRLLWNCEANSGETPGCVVHQENEHSGNPISMAEFSFGVRPDLGTSAMRLHAKALAMTTSPRPGLRRQSCFSFTMPIVHEVQEDPEADELDDNDVEQLIQDHQGEQGEPSGASSSNPGKSLTILNFMDGEESPRSNNDACGSCSSPKSTRSDSTREMPLTPTSPLMLRVLPGMPFTGLG